ncbi:thiamine phosphate synthase [Desertivirga xinjiangensis]|uniref:thiamine phosphate synthase n=1 Tax=Desertivirga xinjiangensis TaxID=539206 RepID=UPI0021093464|nr:thiamine phosphate synthase [Pedobacter xinjiangensis]
MKKYISKFHYLSQDLPGRSHIDQVQLACQSGANWIQYRCLTKNDEDLLNEMLIIASICDDWGATLIVTDHIHLIDKADVQGVHIEDMQADFNAIRASIGPDKTLGASANTFDDIQRIAKSGVVDYIGCGPYSITLTKPNDYPLLGIEGYKTMIGEMMRAGIDIPILAVGGIRLEDIEPLMLTGVFGIAVSSAINLAENPGKTLKEIYNQLI